MRTALLILYIYIASAINAQIAADSFGYFQRYHYTIGTNLIVQQDTLFVVSLPAMSTADSTSAYYGLLPQDTLLMGDTVVVANFFTDTLTTPHTVWVKIAHDNNNQGWLLEEQVNQTLHPINIISYAISVFSSIHTLVFVIIIAVFAAALFILRRRAVRRAARSIDALYSILPVVITAMLATLYESIQMFAPEVWEHYYFNPALNPIGEHILIAMFIVGVWLWLCAFAACVYESRRRLPVLPAVLHAAMVGISCILCYAVFMFTVRIYVGYALLLLFLVFFVTNLLRKSNNTYRCGHCNAVLHRKGKCPVCSAINE